MTRRGWLAGSAAMGAALVAACGGPTGADTAQVSGAPSLKGLEKEYLALPPPPANRKVVLDSLVLLRALPKVRGMNDIYEPAFTQTLNRAYAGEITATEAARLIDEKATPLIKKG